MRSTCSRLPGVLDVPAAELDVDSLGQSLVVTASSDRRSGGSSRDLLGRCEIGRLNLGPVPTSVLEWDQPHEHEGNIFTQFVPAAGISEGVRTQ